MSNIFFPKLVFKAGFGLLIRYKSFRICNMIYAQCCYRHCFDDDPDTDPNFHVDTDPDPDTNWHQNDADPRADPTPSFTYGMLEKENLNFFTFSHSFARLQCFIFLISVKGVIILSFLNSI